MKRYSVFIVGLSILFFIPYLVFGYTYTRHLSVGKRGEDVRQLQIFLNTNGFPVTTSGDGSRGKETTYFGNATRAALAKFQKANNIYPPEGYFGPLTRSAVMNYVKPPSTVAPTPNPIPNPNPNPYYPPNPNPTPTPTPILEASCSANPSSVTADQNVIFSVNVTGGTGSYNYYWYSDDGRTSSALAYVLSYTTQGTKTMTFTVTSGNQTKTVNCTVNVTTNSNNQTTTQAPVNTIAPVANGSAVVGNQLVCTPGTWINLPTTYSYKWKRGGVDIAGATILAYMLQAADIGQSINCTVTASNSAGSASANSNAVTVSAGQTVVVTPSNTVAPSLTGTTVSGNALTCVVGTWANSPTGYAYVWKRNGNPISGATAATYTLQAADVGQAVKCTVTASNTAGSASADSNTVTPTGQVTVTAPTNTAAPAITGNAVSGQTLSCSQGSWNGSMATFSFVWKRAGSAIAGATQSTYTIQTADIAQQLKCTVTATNTAGTASADSNTVIPTGTTTNPTTISNAGQGKIIGTKLIFGMNNPSDSPDVGFEPHVMDLTTGVVTLLKDINPGSASSDMGESAAGGPNQQPANYVVFRACNSTNGCEPWVTDGTPAGTSILGYNESISEIIPGSTGSNPRNFASEANNQVFFLATKTDGKSSGFATGGSSLYTARIAYADPAFANTNSASLYTNFAYVNFDGNTAAKGTEPYFTFTHSGGVVLMGDINLGAASSDPRNFGTAWDTFNSPNRMRMLYSANNGTDGHEPYYYDDPQQGSNSIYLGNLASGSASSDPYNFGFDNENNFYFITSNTGGVRSLWKTSGTAASTVKVVADLGVTPLEEEYITVWKRYIFVATNSAGTKELWVSDGTANGTKKLANVTNISDMKSLGFWWMSPRGVFIADGGSGKEVWSTDGVTTVALKHPTTGGTLSNPSYITHTYKVGNVEEYNSLVRTRYYFGANYDSNGTTKFGIFWTDGTQAGTNLLY